MEKLRLPVAMQFGASNLAETWRQWEQQFHVYFDVAELSQKAVPMQVAILLNAAGPEALEVYNTFNIPQDRDPPTATMAEVLAKFREYCQPKKNTIYERYNNSGLHVSARARRMTSGRRICVPRPRVASLETKRTTSSETRSSLESVMKEQKRDYSEKQRSQCSLH